MPVGLRAYTVRLPGPRQPARSASSPRAAQRARRPGADCAAAGTPGRCSGMSGGTLDGALGRVVAWGSMGTSAGHSGAAVRCIREGARECVPGRSRGTGRRALRLTSRSTRAPGSRRRSPPAQRACSGRRLLHEFPAQLVCKREVRRNRDRPIDVRKRLLASPCRREHRSEVHVRCVVGAKRKSLAVRCDARLPSLDARSIAVLAGAARHGSRMHDPRCGATRLLWHRQSRHLVSIHAPLRWGGHPRIALDRRRASNHAPAREDGRSADPSQQGAKPRSPK